MKGYARILAWGLLALAGAAAAQESPKLDTNLQKYSYAIGLQMGHNLRRQGLTGIDAAALAAGVHDVFAGKQPRISIDKLRTAVIAYQEEQKKELAALADKNAKEGAAFMEKHKSEQGVVALPSGLQYRVVKKGSGPQPKPTDTVMVQYKGQLLNGKVFDSSYERGVPAEVDIGKVIPGWKEALPMMKVGSKWDVWIPPKLAYGGHGAGGVIGPNETLTFEIELLSIKPPAK